MDKQGVYIGRFCPIHAGHERVIRTMLAECGVENSLLIIGSANSDFSLRNFFSYSERKRFIIEIFTDLKVVGLSDFNSDRLWLEALDDILKVAGINPEEATFYGGCEEDIRFFVNDGRNVRIINRFGGGPKIAATEIRDRLIHRQYSELDEQLNPAVIPLVVSTFEEKWEDFMRI